MTRTVGARNCSVGEMTCGHPPAWIFFHWRNLGLLGARTLSRNFEKNAQMCSAIGLKSEQTPGPFVKHALI